jgi:HAD superfamily hydrolase (TIGR01509 family)
MDRVILMERPRGMRAVIFDFDGVLVNSEPLHFRALREALLGEGIAITADEYLVEYVAYDDRGSIRIALERHGRPVSPERVGALAAAKAEAFERLMAEIPFYPGARELVRALAVEMPVAIASGARRGEIERILAAGGLREHFAAVIGADDVTRTKPDPEPYQAAFERIAPLAPGLTPAEVVVFEDTIPGIAAARAAGMKVIGVAQTYPAGKLGLAHGVVPTLEGLGVAEVRAIFERC